MECRYLKMNDAIDVVRETVADEYIESTLELRLLDKGLDTDVRENIIATKEIAGGKSKGSTCWFECSNCKCAVDLSDKFCKHCGAMFDTKNRYI